MGNAMKHNCFGLISANIVKFRIRETTAAKKKHIYLKNTAK